MNGSTLWYATRGAGIVSLLLFTGVVTLGVLASVRWSARSWPRFMTGGFHRNLALLSVVFLVVHIVTAVVDPYAAIGPLAAILPFSAAYRRLWLGLGAVSLDLLLAIVVTSLLRARVGARVWRAVHWLAYAAWPVALLHGVGTGTDSAALWMQLIDALCIFVVVAAAGWRIAMVRPALRRPAAARPWLGSRPSAEAGEPQY